MELIGHRGCAAQYPENTVLAVEESSTRLNAVEIDVRRCGSGELVACHDERVDRVTDAEASLKDLSRRELSELDVLDSGEPVPTVEDVLEAVSRDVTLQLELKEPGVVDDLRSLIDPRPVECRVSSFLPETLAEVRDAGWPVSSGFLFGDDPRENVERALELGCDAVHPHYELCLETDVVQRARSYGLDVLAWNTDSPDVVDALRSRGVDGVTADRWDIAPEEAAAFDGPVAATD